MKLELPPIISNKELTKFPDLNVAQYNNVKNIKQILSSVRSADSEWPECAVIDADRIISLVHLKQACLKAYLNQLNSCMIARTFYTEILVALSDKTNISEALKVFGIGNKTKSILIIVKGSLDQFQNLVDGEILQEFNLKTNRNDAVIKKHYGLKDVDANVWEKVAIGMNALQS